MELVIKWQDKTETWNEIDLDAILHMPVRYACDLFSNEKIPVIAKQDEFYIVNTQELLQRYLKRSLKVRTFKTLLEMNSDDLDRPLSVRGFDINATP